jgi:hypothetical protein
MLPSHATFGELVALARTLDQHGAGDSTESCLLGANGDASRLGAAVLPAVRPMPDAPAALVTTLDSGGRVRVLSHWGQTGDGEFALATFTTVSAAAARAPAAVLALTRAGVFVRYGDREARPDDGPLAPHAIPTRLASAPAHALYLTAERDMPVSELHALLASLPLDRPVALAVALPAGTRLPEPTRPGRAAHACPDGLPAPPRGAQEGDLAAAEIANALASLPAEAARCRDTAGGAAAAGGKLTLALRVEPDGRVRDACAVRDSVSEPALVACLVGFARGLRFSAPAPAGFVDLHVPLDLAPAGPEPQRPTCP